MVWVYIFSVLHFDNKKVTAANVLNGLGIFSPGHWLWNAAFPFPSSTDLFHSWSWCNGILKANKFYITKKARDPHCHSHVQARAQDTDTNAARLRAESVDTSWRAGREIFTLFVFAALLWYETWNMIVWCNSRWTAGDVSHL